ncbi:helix-turn-helix transcriptional regulator [Hydrocarboniclastica marina]|uniref:WYL domain-containing protein n=1 Tax=Hydrocarboniclastica marina TaxID=2259620 RepID=A0A4P7XKT4_9ALTE|nr:WYL domain-containing protein [Hydrocarboniclastica marina]QCF27515.1 WYL domain-containing protein [Hydrocarboniclastica marina]
MGRLNRIYKIHDLLRNARRPVPMRRFLDELEATRNTVTRDFEYMRDSLGAPIAYCREANGHHYDPAEPVFELPGLWMSPGELYALLACEQLLEAVQPGMMTHRLAPLKTRIRALLGEAGHDAERISERIRVQPMQVRSTSALVFDPVAEATLGCKRLRFTYRNRSNQQSAERTADPQRLLHYRSNWYLLAQCTRAKDLRLFSVDRITSPTVLDEPAPALPDEPLSHFIGSSFGIFGGAPTAMAHLRFSDNAAQWVAEECWHPDQISEWRQDGFHLQVPYAVSRELVMEVLRYGPEVEVLGPPELRENVTDQIKKMAGIY